MTAPADRDRAFERAAETRRHRAEYEAVVESGGADLSAIFARADTDPVIGGMKLLPLLEALPEVGKVQSRRAMEAAGIAETARAATVDDERRTVLLTVLFAPGTAP